MISVSLLRKTRYSRLRDARPVLVGAGRVEGLGISIRTAGYARNYFQRFFIRCIIVGEDHFEVRVAGVLEEAIEQRESSSGESRRNHDN